MAIYNLTNLPNKKTIFVFDTNILLYLNGIYNSKNQFEKYTKIAEFLIKNKCDVYLDTLVFNEFVNKFIVKKLGHRFDKKNDRNTKKYNNCLKEIEIIVDNLRNIYNIKWSNNQINLFDRLLNINYEREFNLMEFSDWSIKETVKQINGILITNDKDFKKSAENNDLDILIQEN